VKSKAARFAKSDRNICNDLLYDVTNKHKRYESYSKINMGLGERSNFVAGKDRVPSPTRYEIKSSTELNKIRKKGFIMGHKLHNSTQADLPWSWAI